MVKYTGEIWFLSLQKLHEHVFGNADVLRSTMWATAEGMEETALPTDTITIPLGTATHWF